MNTLKLIRGTLAAGLLLGLAAALPAQTADLGEGSMQAAGDGGRILPLKHTDVKAEISGFAAEVVVTQVFGNPADKYLEAVYVFPLPENAAVNEMTLVVGDRVIKGQIKKRAEARQVYEEAKAQGKTAALLDQERPNIFTQSVANIPPGKEIKVTLKYIQTLAYDHGVYRFSFPMTVGPRYIPGEPAGKQGNGWAHDTAAVPDASLITPPVTRPGQRSGRDISLEVRLNAGIAVKNIRSGSHEITLTGLRDTGATIGLDPEDRIPNKDFLLTYEPAGKAVDAAVITHKTGKDGYLTLMLQPKADFPLSEVTPKELVFALDVSGSMSGFPVETAKETALRCLAGMNPGDTFQIFSFASGNKLHFDKPLKNTPENVALGRAVINGLNGGGGTEMLDALRQVLEFPKDPERMRIVLFMTDGYIGNETQILAFIKDHLNNSRIFPLGVGSSPNRYLLEEMAVMGKGTVQYVRQDEKHAKLEKVIENFYERISKPVLTDLSMDWNGLEVLEQTPSAIPDLFAGQPVYVHARYNKSGSAEVRLKGKLRGKAWEMPVKVTLPAAESANAAMGPLWAKARITQLSRFTYGGASPDAVEKITMLGLEHGLVTEYTSFVAVDQSTAAAGQKPMLVNVESELPEGTRYEGFFGGAGGAVAAARGAAVSMAGNKGISFESKSVYSPNLFQAPAEADKLAQAAPAAPAAGGNGAAALAAELLASPDKRLARQLVSLQDASGTFTGPDGSKVTLAEHALALLALVKARAQFGADLDYAVNAAWGHLRGRMPAGIGAKRAVTDALKSGPARQAGVYAELEALAAELAKLN
jgi:Ca-activated chloride channel family protein